MKRQVTLDGFSFVKTKQRYKIHKYIYILNSIVFLCILYFVCMLFHGLIAVLKHNIELTNSVTT